MRDGASVGRRLSSVGIDFEGGADNTLLLSGNFRLGGSLNANLKIPASHPTNPFRHKFHPDHAQGHLVERSLSLDFAKEGETPFVSADLGYREMGGGYRETITGLHHRPIQVQGTFRLIRVAETTELNPQPRLN